MRINMDIAANISMVERTVGKFINTPASIKVAVSLNGRAPFVKLKFSDALATQVSEGEDIADSPTYWISSPDG